MEVKNSLQLRVLSFNILAEVWANPDWYKGIDKRVLDSATRMKCISRTIRESEAHIVCLQEVQDISFKVLHDEFDSTYLLSPLCANNPTDAKNEQGQMIPNGTVIMVKRDTVSVFEPKAVTWLPSTGTDTSQGHGTTGTIAHIKLTAQWSNRSLFLVNCHLDFDSTLMTTKQQWAAVADQICKHGNVDAVICCGDMNIVHADMKQLCLTTKGTEYFTDTLNVHSHDWTYFGNGGPKRTDYILYKSHTLVHDANRSYLIESASAKTQPEMCTLNLRMYGSDHCPVLAVLVVNTN